MTAAPATLHAVASRLASLKTAYASAVSNRLTVVVLQEEVLAVAEVRRRITQLENHLATEGEPREPA